MLRTCLFLIVLQRSFALRLALQQAENVLLGGVGLGQHRGGRLLQDLVFGQVCGFQSKVCILDAAFGSRQVGRDVGQVVHSVVQPVGHRTQFGTLNIDCLDGGIDSDRSPGVCLGGIRLRLLTGERWYRVESQVHRRSYQQYSPLFGFVCL